MAKKGSRVQVILECTEHKTSYAWYFALHYYQEQEKYPRTHRNKKVQFGSETYDRS